MNLTIAKWGSLLIAMLIAICAGGFSVYGLGHLFGGAALAVMVMASILEVAKLIAASVLERFYKKLSIALKIYLCLAIIVLMIITSAGIYGFLTNAYQTTYASLEITSQKQELLEAKKLNFTTQKEDLQLEKNKLDESISALREGLSKPAQVQYIDSKTGEKITTTSSATRKSLESQLLEAISRRDLVANKIEVFSDSVASYSVKIIEINQNNKAASELGPIRFLSEFFEKDMNSVANLVILLFVIVFDPLAVALIITSNVLFRLDSERKKAKITSTTDTDSSETVTREVIATDRVEEISTVDETIDQSVEEPQVLPKEQDNKPMEEPQEEEKTTVLDQVMLEKLREKIKREPPPKIPGRKPTNRMVRKL